MSDRREELNSGRGLPLDETLVYVAADLIWEAHRIESDEKNEAEPDGPSPHHRRHEFPFTIYEGNDGLTGHRYIWTPNNDKRVTDEGHPTKRNCPGDIDHTTGCVCPPWMDCYCGAADA